MNTHIPEEYGGLNLSSVESCIIAENISYGCAGIGFVPGLSGGGASLLYV